MRPGENREGGVGPSLAAREVEVAGVRLRVEVADVAFCPEADGAGPVEARLMRRNAAMRVYEAAFSLADCVLGDLGLVLSHEQAQALRDEGIREEASRPQRVGPDLLYVPPGNEERLRALERELAELRASQAG